MHQNEKYTSEQLIPIQLICWDYQDYQSYYQDYQELKKNIA